MSQLQLPEEGSSSPRRAALVWTGGAFLGAIGLIGLWYLARWIVGC